MHGLKFRKTRIDKIIADSLRAADLPDTVEVVVESALEDDAAWIDHERMAAALADLERNAAEAMPQGGRLTISAAGDETCVTLRVNDEGRGISGENLPLLFTPFFTTKPVGDGTGLSLPQAYATVKGHSGDIAVVSNADPAQGATGTTVSITLPRKQTFQAPEAKMILHGEED